MEAGMVEESLTGAGFKGKEMKKSHLKKRCTIIFIACLALLAILALGLGWGMWSSGQGQPIAIGAVAADHPACSEVGRDILIEGGSAVDAAIASLLCGGIRQPHSMGIGGGSFMVIYQKNPRQVDVINGREFAPLGATIDKFVNKTFRQGPLSIAVPAEVMAYWEAHKRYGKLPWARIFQPAIKMARDGHPLSNSTARALKILSSRFNISFHIQYPELCKMFCDKTGKVKNEGDEVKMPALAETLTGIARDGPGYLYKGPVADTLLREIKGFGGLLTRADFDLNLTRLQRPLAYQCGNLTLYVPTAPSGGPVLGLILEILEGFNLKPSDMETLESEAATYHKMIEAFKFTYADRLRLGDPKFLDIKELLEKMKSQDYAALLRERIDTTMTHDSSFYSDITGTAWDSQGTTHVNVLSPNGDAVSVTSTINYYFGSLLVSPSTGIILNNEMADFSIPDVSYLDGLKDAPPNYIAPSKQPLSSMVPSIFVDKSGEVRLVIGASGGARISTVTAQVVARILWLKESLQKAVREKRFHHQLFPNVLKYEPGFNQDILDLLHKRYGHSLKARTTYMAVLQAIHRDPDTNSLHAFSDERKKGRASYVFKEDLRSN